MLKIFYITIYLLGIYQHKIPTLFLSIFFFLFLFVVKGRVHSEEVHHLLDNTPSCAPVLSSPHQIADFI